MVGDQDGGWDIKDYNGSWCKLKSSFGSTLSWSEQHQSANFPSTDTLHQTRSWDTEQQPEEVREGQTICPYGQTSSLGQWQWSWETSLSHELSAAWIRVEVECRGSVGNPSNSEGPQNYWSKAEEWIGWRSRGWEFLAFAQKEQQKVG